MAGESDGKKRLKSIARTQHTALPSGQIFLVLEVAYMDLRRLMRWSIILLIGFLVAVSVDASALD